MVTAFEIGLSEAEFWRTAPRVFEWKMEAFVRNDMREYIRGLQIGAGSKGDHTPDKVAKTLRLYDTATTAADALANVSMNKEEVDDLTKKINKK